MGRVSVSWQCGKNLSSNEKLILFSQLWQGCKPLVCQEQLHVQDFGIQLTKEHCTLSHPQLHPSVSLGQRTEGTTEVSFTAKPTRATKPSVWRLWGWKGWRRRSNVYSWVRAAENYTILPCQQNRAQVCFIGVQAICLSSKGKFYPLHFKDSCSFLSQLLLGSNSHLGMTAAKEEKLFL